MARLCVIFLIFIITNVLMVQSIANENVKSSSNNSPAEAPAAQIPGKRSHHGHIVSSHAPSKSPENKGTEQPSYIEDHSGEHCDESGEAEDLPLVQHHQHRHWIDKSSTGGGVILGGLATTFLGAIVCYIRATRRKHTTVHCDKVVDPSDKV